MRKWYPALTVVAAVALSVALWPRLPERVAVHWNVDGVPDGHGSRLVAALVAPMVMLGLWGLLRWLPRIDPRRENFQKFAFTYDLVVNAVLTLLLAMHAITLGIAIGYPLPVERLAPAMIGALLVLIGNLLPRARPNWWFGIRTPWTLSNDRVWERTHRVGGYLLVGAGLVAMASALLPPRPGFVLFMVAVIGSSLASLGYSYVAWREETSR